MHAAGEDGDSLQGSNADSERDTSEHGDMAAQFVAATAEARRGSRDYAPAEWTETDDLNSTVIYVALSRQRHSNYSDILF